jgi:hypothetical protein
MKKILLTFSISILVLQPILCQDIFPKDEKGNIVYTEIVNVDSTNLKELYVRAHTWFANNFKSAKSVIQLDDKEAGKIIGKGYFLAGIPKSNSGVVKSAISVSVYFTVDIQVKDGRYRYLFSDFSCIRFEATEYETTYDLLSTSFIKNAIWQKSLDKDWLEIKQDINSRILNIIETLKKAMKTSTNNW